MLLETFAKGRVFNDNWRKKAMDDHSKSGGGGTIKRGKMMSMKGVH